MARTVADRRGAAAVLKGPRKLVAVAGVLLATGVGPVHGEEMPWCVELDVFTKNCAFATRDECQAVAANAASPATGQGRCIRNPNYRAPAAAVHGKSAPIKASEPRR